MSTTSRLERGLRQWLHEDAHEDPSRVLARVDAVVASRPQQLAFPRWMRSGGSRLRMATAIGIALALLVLAAALPTFLPGVPGPTPTSLTPTPGPSTVPGQTGIANDEPCTRTLPVDAVPPANPYHHEDLARMVLRREDAGGLDGFDPDVVRQGYHDNAELSFIEINPSSTCDDLAELGRIEGYGNAWSRSDGTTVMFAVHLFWTPDEGRRWVDAYVAGLQAEVADTTGVSMTVDPAGLGITDSLRIRHAGADGMRDLGIFWRGPVVGWVLDLRRLDTPTFDVAAAAAVMAERVAAVNLEVSTRRAFGLDVVRLLSAPLPRSAWGDLATDSQWDSFFGGCQDNAERGFVAGEKALADAERFGRIAGCTAMYVPVVPSVEVVRVFSSVHLYAESLGASSALAENIADQERAGGERFSVEGLGEEAVGVATPGGGEGNPSDTRVVFRVGDLLLWVSVQGTVATESRDRLVEIGHELEVRIRVLGGG